MGVIVRYVSSRGQAPRLGFADVLLAGLASDGGLYVPETWPTVSAATVEGFAEDADNYLILVRVTPGQPFTYYMGSAWDRGLDFHSREEWERFVATHTFDFGR